MPETTPSRDRGDYYVLPDDSHESLNILREAAGLGPWRDADDRSPQRRAESGRDLPYPHETRVVPLCRREIRVVNYACPQPRAMKR